jgi:pimeloyl-ACP methyl ester carboxylesterase
MLSLLPQHAEHFGGSERVLPCFSIVPRGAIERRGAGYQAVRDAWDTGQAVLFGVTFGCPVVIRFAASFPDRTQALVLAGGFAKLTRLGGLDFAADPAQVGE